MGTIAQNVATGLIVEGGEAGVSSEGRRQPPSTGAENHRSPMDRTALFSSCRTFRYRLGRRWSEGPVLAFIMLNPSCADEHIDDPSVRRCIGFARRLGYGALEVVNLYAFLATDPAELRRAGYPVGPGNDQQITEAVHESSRVVAAWGVHAARLGRPAGGPRVVEASRGGTVLPSCHQQRTSGAPAATPSSCELRPFEG